MKLLFISDIHGIKTNLGHIQQVFTKEKCDKLIVLGDLYYTYGYDNDKEDVEKFLNSFKDKLICVRGNCDDEDTIKTSLFIIYEEIYNLKIDDLNIYLTHGHIYNKNNFNKTNSILILGHEHIPYIQTIDSNIFINVGSISLPRGNNKPTYMIYDNKTFTIYTINDEKIDEITI